MAGGTHRAWRSWETLEYKVTSGQRSKAQPQATGSPPGEAGAGGAGEGLGPGVPAPSFPPGSLLGVTDPPPPRTSHTS